MMKTKLQKARLFWERVIWVTDQVGYLLLGLAGLSIAFEPSGYVLDVVHWRWAVTVWGLMLAFGGLTGLIGRLSRLWAVEYPANVLACWGAVLYGLVMLPAVLRGELFGTLIIVLLVHAFMLRRHAELRILTNEPDIETIAKRLEAAWRRRTENVVPREHY